MCWLSPEPLNNPNRPIHEQGTRFMGHLPLAGRCALSDVHTRATGVAHTQTGDRRAHAFLLDAGFTSSCGGGNRLYGRSVARPD